MPTIELRIREVVCVDETGGSWVTERGQDDIYLAAVMVDYRGGVGQTPLLPVSNNFDDGEKVSFDPPKTLGSCWVPGSSQRDYAFATIVLIERDAGGSINKFMLDLERETRASLPQVVRGRALGTGESKDGNIDGKAVAAAIKAIASFAAVQYKKAREDDIFPPKIVQTNLFEGGLSSTGDTVDFEGHNGKYRVAYEWALKA